MKKKVFNWLYFSALFVSGLTLSLFILSIAQAMLDGEAKILGGSFYITTLGVAIYSIAKELKKVQL